MHYKIYLLLLLSFSCCIGAPFVADPLRNGQPVGTGFLEWTVDINHDGLNDILLCQTIPDDEKNDVFPDLHGFGVYLGQKNGGYINTQYLNTPTGREEGGIDVDVSQCYVGYIDEVKAYGIVTVLAEWGRHKGIHHAQVVCYTVEGDHMKQTHLGGVMDDPATAANAIYNKYLSLGKRTKVQLKQVQIPK
jgi:hypothetical protein